MTFKFHFPQFVNFFFFPHRYHLDVVSDLVKDSRKNPEVDTELKRNQPLIMAQVNILERNIKLIKSALNGNTAQCVEDCEVGSGEDGSGEGSGKEEGSGQGETDDGERSGEGSGGGDDTKTTPESRCANDATGDCVEVDTLNPNVHNNNLNDITFVPHDPNAAQSRSGGVGAPRVCWGVCVGCLVSMTSSWLWLWRLL